ncbi:hypothetical protein MRX96_036953 [Rhipicephalus microplus]
MKDPPPGACCASSAVDGQPGSSHQGALTGAAVPSGGGGFDDDYNEWELGIGDLIIDLDADIEKSNDPMASSSAAASPPVEHQATVDKGLKMKIKRKNLAKHEIVKAQDTGASPPPLAPLPSTKHSSSSVSSSSSSSSSSKSSGRSGSHKKKRIENGASPPRLQCSLGAPLPLPPPISVPSSCPPLFLHHPRHLQPPLPFCPPPMEQTAANGVPSSPPRGSLVWVECPGSPAKVVAASTSVERKDSGVLCTSVGTITEPDCLGPCEPGTSVTLEGIVWQETEGGVLVVNVTWRGKTYVGTLLDCTRHDWAPPRFSPVQGKLRNGKGRRFAVPCSPAKNEGRRRSKPPELELSPPDKKRARARSTPTPEAPCSPALILCPEPNCGKKYKHINAPCSPESPHVNVAPPSPAKVLATTVETPALHSDPNRPHKRPHKKSKSRKPDGNGSVVMQDEAPEGKPVSIAGPGSSVDEDSKKDVVSRDKATKEVGSSRPQEGKKPDTDFPQFPPYSLCAASPFVQGAPAFSYDPYRVHIVDPPFKEDKGTTASSKEPTTDKAPPPEKAPPTIEAIHDTPPTLSRATPLH